MSASACARPPGLSVFFPAYNDSGTIASMVIRAVQAAAELTPDYEVIVVDDGSSDATARIADELFAALDAPVRRVGALDTWVGYHPQLEAAILPQVDGVAREMEKLLAY